MIIAKGSSRKARVWKNIDVSWEKLESIFSKPRRTVETVEEYKTLPKEIQDNIKDVGRKVASLIGIEMFDDTTYEPARLMYWPSTSSDGEFIFRNQKTMMLDPEQILSTYENWRDASQWPVSSRQQWKTQRYPWKYSSYY